MKEPLVSMFGERLYITGTLALESAFHVGSGEFEEDERLRRTRPDSGDEETTSVAVLLKGIDGKPFLPGSTLKGVLARLARLACPPNDVAYDTLFGRIKKKKERGEEVGQMGTAVFYGTSVQAAGATSLLPFNASGVFLQARVAIDDETGAAEASKLFHQELVAARATCDLRIRYFHPPNSNAENNASGKQARALLARLLKTLIDKGTAVGKGRNDGQGRIRLAETLRVTREYIGSDGRRAEESDGAFLAEIADAAPIVPAAIAPPIVLKLTCNGPFFVRDPSYDPNKARREIKEQWALQGRNSDDEPKLAQLKAQRSTPNVPLLPLTSLMGALRARAEWMEKLARLRSASDGYKSGLSPSERLFGRAPRNQETERDRRAEPFEGGFAGLLHARTIETEKANTRWFTSVSLDRFSGAPRQDRLFTTEAFVGASFTVELMLDDRPGQVTAANQQSHAKYAQDHEFLRELMDDICNNGLFLGGGFAKGFGWFDVDWLNRTSE